MLKKSLKKLLAVTLTAVTLVTSAMPVSASTLTPKKSHSDSEVQSRVQYLIDAADDIAFSPWYGFAADMDVVTSRMYTDRHNKHSYRAYQMCDMLLATPNLTSACSSEEIADLKQARTTWKKAYISDIMYAFYQQVWYETYCIVDDKYLPGVRYKNSHMWNADKKGNIIMPKLQTDALKKKATSSYNRVKNYIAKYQSYNPTLASKLNKWNAEQYKFYKAVATKAKGFNEAKYLKTVKYTPSTVFDSVQDYYKLGGNFGTDVGALSETTKLQTKVSNWYWIDKDMHPKNLNKNSQYNVFMRNTKYTTW